MRMLRVIGTIMLVAITLGFVGFLTWITEPEDSNDITPESTAALAEATRRGGFGPVTRTPIDATACNAFNSWVWAQTTFEADRDRLATSLDPDGNGLACESLPVDGFAPVSWAREMPENVVPVTLDRVIDGDTISVNYNGALERVRLKAIDAPEVANPNAGVSGDCGGDASTRFLRSILDYAPGNTLYLEFDDEQRDMYGRLLAYVWFRADGHTYLANESMVRSGWAVSTTRYLSDRRYGDQIDAGKQFSIDHVMGVPLLCGQFGQPEESTPDAETVERARSVQPDQGQFPQPTTGA